MVKYFRLVSEELLIKLNQVKQFITKHNTTIGTLTEEAIRDFLKKYLPKSVSVEQGFVMSTDGQISKQCDILIYDSIRYAPFYRLNDIVIVPADSVLAVIEVKTTLTKQILHGAIDYFRDITLAMGAVKYLFIYNTCDLRQLEEWFLSYKHPGEYQKFDHDTFDLLPDEITGINNSYHLKRNYAITDRDMMGYTSYFTENEEGTEISALENFYLSIYNLIENHNSSMGLTKAGGAIQSYFEKRKLKSYFAIGLFDM